MDDFLSWPYCYSGDSLSLEMEHKIEDLESISKKIDYWMLKQDCKMLDVFHTWTVLSSSSYLLRAFVLSKMNEDQVNLFKSHVPIYFEYVKTQEQLMLRVNVRVIQNSDSVSLKKAICNGLYDDFLSKDNLSWSEQEKIHKVLVDLEYWEKGEFVPVLINDSNELKYSDGDKSFPIAGEVIRRNSRLLKYLTELKYQVDPLKHYLLCKDGLNGTYIKLCRSDGTIE